MKKLNIASLFNTSSFIYYIYKNYNSGRHLLLLDQIYDLPDPQVLSLINVDIIIKTQKDAINKYNIDHINTTPYRNINLAREYLNSKLFEHLLKNLDELNDLKATRTKII